MIGAGEIAKMKDRMYLVNCARGGIYAEQALYEALVSGKIAGAGLDVYSASRPGPSSDEAAGAGECDCHAAHRR